MKIQMTLVLVLLTMFAAMESMRRILAAEETRPPVNINPSRGTAPIDPSRTIPPIVPSQTIPPIAPSREISPIAPSRTRPAAPENLGPGGGPVPVQPSALPLTAQIVVAITAGPNELRGLPPFGNAGIPVRGLRVETDRGNVVLRGVVGSERDKFEAGARAAALAGEGKVVNKLTVTPFSR